MPVGATVLLRLKCTFSRMSMFAVRPAVEKDIIGKHWR
ncbi:MAG: hypothetical protein DDT32_01144 [Syntrophomonadaceae bacterium]|nr:hypothetical protein [Bacillota bacterium]